MRPAVALYEFMPYGAPDLIESRRRHMSRALWLTSTMALALYALSSGIAALIPAAPPRAPQTIIVDPQWWKPVAPIPPASSPAPSISKPPPAVHEDAVPLPVPDPMAAVIDPNPSGTTPGPVESSPATKAEPGDPLPPPETLPARGEWVYVELMPAVVRMVEPVYPELGIKADVEGAVTVYVLVGKDGRVVRAELSEKVQVPMLNEAALTAARQWVFTPGYANGKPVACWTAIPFRFRLH